MSMGIRARAINWIVNNAQRNRAAAFANRTADCVGGILQTATRGMYRKKLSRASVQLTLHQNLQAGETLSIKDGQVLRNGSSIFADKKLFEGVDIDQIEVTEKMCAPEGMASYLRWDAIGHMPRLMVTLSSLLGAAIGVWVFGLSFSLTTILTTFYLIPYHRIFTLTPKEHRSGSILLRDIENLPAIEYKTAGEPEGAFMMPYLPGVFFLYSNEISPNSSIVVTHEKAHLLGASEYRAVKAQKEHMFKYLFYDRKNGKSKIPLGNLAVNMAISFGGILVDNLLSLAYFLPRGYHRGAYRRLSHVANNKIELEGLLDSFEKEEKELSHVEAARAYSLCGRYEKALIYYSKMLKHAEQGEEINKRPWMLLKDIFIGDQVFFPNEMHFAIGATYHKMGKKQKAREAFQRVIEISDSRNITYSMAKGALGKLAEESE